MEINGKKIIFSGLFEHTLDSKGRVAVPSKLKKITSDLLISSLVITRGPEDCLYCYTEEKWEEIVSILLSKTGSQPFGSSADRTFFRLFVGEAYKCSLDKLGRIDIPDTLLKVAGIEQNVVFIGNIDHIEIWDSKKWNIYFENNSLNFEKYLAEMSGEGTNADGDK